MKNLDQMYAIGDTSQLLLIILTFKVAVRSAAESYSRSGHRHGQLGSQGIWKYLEKSGNFGNGNHASSDVSGEWLKDWNEMQPRCHVPGHTVPTDPLKNNIV